MRNGKPVNIPVPHEYVRETSCCKLTLLATRTRAVARANSDTVQEYRYDENVLNHGQAWFYQVPWMPGAHEKHLQKDLMCPYQEPALVP